MFERCVQCGKEFEFFVLHKYLKVKRKCEGCKRLNTAIRTKEYNKLRKFKKIDII